jgi:Zn-dependent protease with chaperone function
LVKIYRWRALILCLAFFAALCAAAQDFSDEDTPDDFAEGDAASMSLSFDRQGAVNVSLNLPEDPASVDALQSALAQAFHCAASSFHHPAGYGGLTSFPATWTTQQRERYEKQLAKFSQRAFTGKCNSVLTRQELLLQGDFDYSALAAELQRSGVDHLSVYIELPQATYRDYTQSHLLGAPTGSRTSLMYDIPLDDHSTPAVLHIAFGMRHADVNRALGILAAFILLPIVVTLWMRRKALASARQDAAGAWFGFFRRLNWLVMGAMLLWITSGFGARRVLQEWLADQALSSWAAAAGDVLITVAPAFLIYFACIVFSFPVYSQLRGGRLSRREFLSQQLLTVGAQAIPLTIGLGAIEILHQHLELSVALLVLTVVVLQIFVSLKLRVMKNFPQPLTTGELRDRIFALAGRLGVKISQVFVMPAGKGQVANAYAAKSNVVMFTDYLLEHLTKREVDAVAAHELAHLHHKHPGKRVLAFYGAVLLPSYFSWLKTMLMSFVVIPLGFLSIPGARASVTAHVWGAVNAFDHWSQRDFALIMLGLTGFYFLSRRFENVADATAVRLTGDAEAQITGLLKLNFLNFTPIQWGKVSESWLTHPSTMRRAERIAAAGGMAPERLQQILGQYAAQGGATSGAATSCRAVISVPAEERYAIPAVSDPAKIQRALRDRASRQGKMWVQLLLYVFLPALFSLLIQRMHMESNLAAAMYAAGIVITGVIITLAGVWLGESGHEKEKKRLAERFAREGVPVARDGDVVVGFAPGPYPRLYGARYHWDSGFLVLAKDRMQFVGEQTKFSLLASEIEGIVTGRGGPSWWKFERVYVRWKSADGQRGGTFNLNALEPGSIWRTRECVRELCCKLQDWHRGVGQFSEVRPELAELRSPELGEVTSVSPRAIGKWKVNVKVMGYLLPLAVGVSILTHAEMPYVCTTVVILRIFQTVPYWRYRDELPVMPIESSAELASRPRAAGASAGDVK